MRQRFRLHLLRVLGVACGAALFSSFAIVVSSQGSSEGGYTAAQAGRGQAVYQERCSSCHGVSLRGGTNDFAAPALTGPFFYEKWNGRMVAELFSYTLENMPPGDARLSDTASLDVTAYILQNLKYQPGSAELKADSPIMKQAFAQNP